MTTPVTSSSVKNLGKQSPMRLGAVLLGSLLLRVAAAAGGVLIGFYLAALLETGRILSLAVVGTLGIVVNAAELGGAIPAGLLADRFSARAILVASALLGALATQLFGISGLISVFFLSRTLEGLSGSATTPAILAHLAAVTEAQPSIRGRVMSLFEVTLLGGLAAGALVGGGVWDILNTWAFSAMAALYLVVALLFWWGAGGTPTISKRR